ncbi:GGDEF domain-containing protein [Nocardia huaxiensis]|uniref:GGDEF domain-containing protein n=1 Tax=Nocardia huaxiensis TaxID=2755382 RepID=A0A7D6ZG28_9NOCA|nr:GGDEF domain-containing protein [Nocardia huaxiensis]QLY32838.1 GGDEF domain-containing protein [Nocardia huaxiensis]
MSAVLAAGHTRRGVLRSWWRDPVDYRWLVHTLAARGALTPFKIVLGVGGAVMFVIAVLTWMSPAGPHGSVGHATPIGDTAFLGHVVFVVVIAGSVIWTLRWLLLPWPSRRESLFLLATADILITAACLVDQNRVYGALGSVLLVVTGGYLSIFHGPRILAAHIAWSLASVLVLTGLMLTRHTGDPALATAIVLILAVATAVVLPTLQFCYWVLRTDALSDPLTMVLNRRGLDYHLTDWFRAADSTPICVMLIDLDDFKAVNDTYGHPAGDDILVRTAARLRATADPDAIVARTGGEEFVVVAHLSPAAARTAAEHLCTAVATLPAPHIPITASIGVAAHPGGTPTARNPIHLLDCADAAMYRAKQLGGNAVVLADPRTPAITPIVTAESRESPVRLESPSDR